MLWFLWLTATAISFRDERKMKIKTEIKRARDIKTEMIKNKTMFKYDFALNKITHCVHFEIEERCLMTGLI